MTFHHFTEEINYKCGIDIIKNQERMNQLSEISNRNFKFLIKWSFGKHCLTWEDETIFKYSEVFKEKLQKFIHRSYFQGNEKERKKRYDFLSSKKKEAIL